MPRTRRRTVPGRAVAPAVLAVVAAIGLAVVPAAQAASLNEAKDAGWVGERRDGFVGLVRRDAPADVKALVQEVNRKRQQTYEGIAEKRGTTVVAVAALAGEKLIREAPPGHYVQNPQGQWVKKGG